MKAVWLVLLPLALAACGKPTSENNNAASESAVPAAPPSMSVEATPVDATHVKFVVTTTIPTPVEVMASLGLEGQKPDDVFIGTDEKVTLNGPRTEFILDTSDARKPLPSGNYEAEVSFYPRWGADNGNPAAKSVPELSAKARIALGGSGEDRKDAERRNELQRWVMSNISMNVPWNRANYEARLGKASKGPSTMSHLHDAYYFPDADMTLMVNRLKNEVTIWRMGDVTE